MKNLVLSRSAIGVWITLCFTMGLLVSTSNSVLLGAALQQNQDGIALVDSGLEAELPVEKMLPSGAVAHLQINGSGSLLGDLSKMLTPFAPEKLVGPEAGLALQQPNPMLALIGMKTMGQPISVEMLAGISGIDPKRPITLTSYMLPPPHGLLLTIPVLDLNRASAMLNNILPPDRTVSKIESNNGTLQVVSTSDFELFIACSTNTVYISGSPALADALYSKRPGAKMNESGFMAAAFERHKNDNIWLAIDTAPAKPLLPVLNQFSTIPPPAIAEIRADISTWLPQEGIDRINYELRSRHGVKDFDQLMDYFECFATGCYEVAFAELLKFVDDFNGVTLGVDLTDEFQSLRLSVHSDSIKPSNSTAPLPLGKVQNALASVPGSHNYWAFTGQLPKAKKWQFVDRMIKSVSQKMSDKGLPLNLPNSLQTAYDAHQLAQPLESKVEWTAESLGYTGVKLPDEFADLQSYIEGFQDVQSVALKAIPLQEPDFIEKHFAEKAKATNANHANWRNLTAEFGLGESWLYQSSNSRSEELPGDIYRLVYEDSIKTGSGFFGYNEHEFICRYFSLYRNTDDYTLLWPGGNDAKLFGELRRQPVPKAVLRLLEAAELPKDVQRVVIARTIQELPNAVDYLAALESLVCKELDQYLAALQILIEQPLGDEGPDIAQLASVPIPFTVAEVNVREATDELYLVTPLGLTFPRPKFVPVASQLLDDYRAVADSTGGAITYEVTKDGQFEWVAVQSTAGISTLIRTLGNNVAEDYINNPQGMEDLMELFNNALDRSSFEDTTILRNEFWEFLDF